MGKSDKREAAATEKRGHAHTHCPHKLSKRLQKEPPQPKECSSTASPDRSRLFFLKKGNGEHFLHQNSEEGFKTEQWVGARVGKYGSREESHRSECILQLSVGSKGIEGEVGRGEGSAERQPGGKEKSIWNHPDGRWLCDELLCYSVALVVSDSS